MNAEIVEAVKDAANMLGNHGCTVEQVRLPVLNDISYEDPAASLFNTYWNTAVAKDLSSAKGYVPEAVWNESCDLGLPIGLDNLLFQQA